MAHFNPGGAMRAKKKGRIVETKTVETQSFIPCCTPYMAVGNAKKNAAGTSLNFARVMLESTAGEQRFLTELFESYDQETGYSVVRKWACPKQHSLAYQGLYKRKLVIRLFGRTSELYMVDPLLFVHSTRQFEYWNKWEQLHGRSGQELPDLSEANHQPPVTTERVA